MTQPEVGQSVQLSSAAPATSSASYRSTMLVLVVVLVVAAAAILGPVVARAQPAGAAVTIGRTYSLWSNVLGEERPFWVYLPESYDDRRYAPVDYPVLYLLDGGMHFHAATGVVEFMSAGINANMQIPELIVVAIPNVDRTRDLTPTHATNRTDRPPDPTLRASGGGDAFLRFLQHELIPRIEGTYRTAPYRIVVGHSFGGLLAVHAFVAAPRVFQGYLAIDPSLFWDDAIVVRRAEQTPREEDGRPRAVYLSLSGHPPGGRMEEPVRAFAAELQRRESTTLRFRLDRFDDESHGSVPLRSLYRGLQFVFDTYAVTARQLFDRPASLDEHFARVSQRLGVTLRPPERILDLVGQSFLAAGQVDGAVELLTVVAVSHPTSSHAQTSLARALEARGEAARAIEHYERAVELDPTNLGAQRALRRFDRPATPR